jgi:hypothetical protein
MVASKTKIPAPPHGLTMIEGGHFTLRLTPIRKNCWSGYLALIDTKHPPVRGEIKRAAREQNASQSWVLFVRETPDDLHDLPEAKQFDRPSTTQIGTMSRAISLMKTMKEQGQAVKLALLVGDLNLPKELRQGPAAWMVPHEYEELLAKNELSVDDVEVIREAHAQNHGDEIILRKLKKWMRDREHFDERYADQGFGVVRKIRDGQSEYMLFADQLLTRRKFNEPAIALTKTRFDDDGKARAKPSCAVTLAGQLDLLISRGVTRYDVFHDAADDQNIRMKALHGLFVAAQFIDNSELSWELHTLFNGAKGSTDLIQMSNLRGPGERGRFADLVDEARGRIAHLVPEFFDEVTSGPCRPPMRGNR